MRRDRIHKILGPLLLSSEQYLDNSNNVKRYLFDQEIVDKLMLIGCTLENKDIWDVRVIPCRSQDLTREIDLIESARLIGYDKFDLNLPSPIKRVNFQILISFKKIEKWIYRKWF